MPNIYYFCVLDFEATCWEGERRPSQEIIEFPSVLIRVDKFKKTLTKVDEFSRYVRPVLNPELSEFCTSLTGITQEQVNGADIIENVYEEHYQWLQSHVEDGAPLYIVTCGNWDLNTMLPIEIRNKGLTPHHVYSQFVNIKYEFERFYGRKVMGMTGMLEKCGLELEGRHHSGIDDTRNIARVLWKMLEEGYTDPRTKKVKEDS